MTYRETQFRCRWPQVIAQYLLERVTALRCWGLRPGNRISGQLFFVSGLFRIWGWTPAIMIKLIPADSYTIPIRLEPIAGNLCRALCFPLAQTPGTDLASSKGPQL